MKLNDIQLYKKIGTIQMGKNDDGEKCYFYNHFFFNEVHEEDTIANAQERLEYEEKRAQEVKEAIRVLRRHNYKIYKELDKFI